MLDVIMGINLFYFSLNRVDKKDNLGDLLSEYVVSKITKRKINRIPHPSMRRYKYFFRHYLVIGSILEVANTNSIVWGSGIIRKNDFIKKAKFLAVRGPITRNRLMELGYKLPEIYGDPAILLPTIYPKTPKKKYKIGIIPHYVDYDDVCGNFKSDKNVKIIALLTNNVEDVIDEILECEYIISSSLHGVIIPHAYGIPALWVKFSDRLGGDNIKFYDYFESVKILYNQEFHIHPKNLEMNDFLTLLNENNHIMLPLNETIANITSDLLKSNPFK